MQTQKGTKKRHRPAKQLSAIGLAAMLMASFVVSANPAYADNATPAHTIEGPDGLSIRFTDATVNPSMTGSMTIYKLIENNGYISQADGTQQDIQTDTDGKQTVTVKSPNNPDGTDTKEDFNNGGSDKVSSDNDSHTFTGSPNGKSNGNSALEGAQGKTWHTDSARDNETYDGNEYSQTLVVPDVGFSYRKIADAATIPGQQKNKANVGLYFTNIDSDFVSLVNDFGLGEDLKKAVTPITDAAGKTHDASDGVGKDDYFMTASLEGIVSKVENLGVQDTASPYAGKTGALALTDLTRYANAPGTNTANQSTDKAMGNFPLTDKDGRARVEGLPLGLYLIGETDITHHDGLDKFGNPIGRDEDTNDTEYPILKNRVEPFLASVPATNVSTLEEPDGQGGTVKHNPGTVWMYDQYIYPKDSSINISKAIIDPDEKDSQTLRTREDYQIGDIVDQVIWADAPVPQPMFDSTADTDPSTERVANQKRAYERFRISDEMTSSMSFDAVKDVLLIPKVANPTKNTDFLDIVKSGKGLTFDKADYVVSAITKFGEDDKPAYTDDDYKTRNLHNFTVTLTASGLEKLNAIEEDSQVVVFFDSTLNKNAMIGPTDATQNTEENPSIETAANENQASLDYKDSAWPEQQVLGNRVYVFTHALNLKKNGLADPTKAQFVVTRDNNADYAAVNVTNPKNVKEENRNVNGSYLAAFGRDSVDTKALNFDNFYYRNAPDASTGHIAFVKDADGVYHLYDNALDDISNTQNNNGYTTNKTDLPIGKEDNANYDNVDEETGEAGNVVTVLHPAPDGTLYIKGLDAEANTYTFKEVGTENGHALLNETFDIHFAEKDKNASETKVGTDKYNDEDVWKDGRLVSYPTDGADGNNVTDGTCVTVGKGSDTLAAALAIDHSNAGIAEVEIDNGKVATLRTGGTGRTMIYILGIACGAGLCVYGVATRKKKKQQNQAE